MDAWTPQLVVTFLLGGVFGALLAWSPRLVVFRLHKRVAELEFNTLQERNQRAAKARWERDPAKDPTVAAMLAAKENKIEKFANDW